MASLLRTLIAGPRARHAESGLDLCYVTDNIIATSGPSGTYPQIVYRNPLSALIQHLDAKHGNQWAIWEFRAEGTGYSDDAVYNRIYHYPFPDHMPPPFEYIPRVMASMRHWLDGGAVSAFDTPALETGEENKRIVVIHCKAGKGRTGTMSASYLMCEQGCTLSNALSTFTAKRMRPGFGEGVSIPSQLRYLGYVDRWRGPENAKQYTESSLKITAVHIWGLREGVSCAIKGYDKQHVLQTFHDFTADECQAVDSHDAKDADSNAIISEVKYVPSTELLLPSSDVMISFVKRGAGLTASMTVVTAVAHTWFNAYFEGNGPEQKATADTSGTFQIEWEALDGLKGTTYRGARALVKLAVDWERIGKSVEVEPSDTGDITGRDT